MRLVNRIAYKHEELTYRVDDRINVASKKSELVVTGLRGMDGEVSLSHFGHNLLHVGYPLCETAGKPEHEHKSDDGYNAGGNKRNTQVGFHD